MKLYPFSIATGEDVKGIIEIEKNFFDKGVAYTEDFIQDWMNYNPNMFYVVKDNNNVVKAFTILVPVTEQCYQALIKNEITDMNQFQKEHVLNEIQSKYYYFADIAASNKDPFASVSLLNGIQIYLCENAQYVVTTPITNDGERVCQLFGFGPEITKGKNCVLKVTPEVIEKRKLGFARRKIKKDLKG